MFTKVLIAEDMDDIHKGIFNTVAEFGIEHIEQVQYCDDAYIKFKKARLDKEPFDLLITDLSFKEDHREQSICNGEDLIKLIRAEDPSIKIITYSVEDRLQKVRSLLTNLKTNAYVCKGRSGLKELSNAIETIANDGTYLSPEVKNALSPQNDLEIETYDILLLEHLSKGLSQEDISQEFTKNGISPSSLSSIEKKISKLRIQFKANNAIHLVAMAKDLGLI